MISHDLRHHESYRITGRAGQRHCQAADRTGVRDRHPGGTEVSLPGVTVRSSPGGSESPGVGGPAPPGRGLQGFSETALPQFTVTVSAERHCHLAAAPEPGGDLSYSRAGRSECRTAVPLWRVPVRDGPGGSQPRQPLSPARLGPAPTVGRYRTVPYLSFNRSYEDTGASCVVASEHCRACWCEETRMKDRWGARAAMILLLVRMSGSFVQLEMQSRRFLVLSRYRKDTGTISSSPPCPVQHHGHFTIHHCRQADFPSRQVYPIGHRMTAMLTCVLGSDACVLDRDTTQEKIEGGDEKRACGKAPDFDKNFLTYKGQKYINIFFAINELTLVRTDGPEKCSSSLQRSISSENLGTTIGSFPQILGLRFGRAEWDSER
eukprot:763227-Hanusia_phi.AAC.2